MSLQNLAKELEKKGRGKDRMLVHMTPKEVSGLQAIAKAHGGSLTVNPDTGLVEAGFLDDLLPSLLPMAAGAALTIGSGGALSPLAAAMITGGGYGLATGSVEKGLMAGLGAYGGAGLAGGLANTGAAATATEAQTAATAVDAANAGVIPSAEAGTASLANSTPVPGATDSVRTAFNLPTAPQATPLPPAGTVTPNTGVYTGDLGTFTPAQQNTIIAQRNAVMSTPGIENIVSQPSGGISSGQMLNNARTGINQLAVEGGPTALYNALPTGTLPSAGMSLAAGSLEPQPYVGPEEEKYTGGYRLSPNFKGYTPQRPNPYYRPTGLGYAMGGQIPQLNNMPAGGLAALQGMRDGYGATQTMDGNIPQFAEGGQAKKPAKAKMTGARNVASMDPYEAAMAELNNARAGANMSQMNMPKAGLAELGALPYAAGGMASGRYLSGGGDGMSDSIPATINNKQPARLADGEFVVPADVVSHLGNGSSNAGAKKLYGMMDKVRTARTGKKKQAPAVKTDKYMPA